MNPSDEGSKIIWNKIAAKYSHCIKGKILRSSRQDFSPNASTYKEDEITSNFGHLLIGKAWLPMPDGSFVRPSELSLDDLPDLFIRDEKLADQLGMKKDVVAKLAKEAGISQDIINLARTLERHPDIRKKIESLLQEQDRKQPEFPQRSPADPERRQERLAEQMNEAPEKEYEQRNRSLRTTKGTVDEKQWLKEQYTNSAGQMIC